METRATAHTKTHEVRQTTYAHALDYVLISHDISLYENNETDV